MAGRKHAASPLTDHLNWLHSIDSYLKVSDESCLDLNSKGIGVEEVKSVLQLLSSSQITELNLEGNNLHGGMKVFSNFLMKTEITVLSFKDCHLSAEDLIHLFKVLKNTQITDLDISCNEIAMNENVSNELVSFLRKSYLTALNFQWNAFPLQDKSAVPLIQELLNTSITVLNLSRVFKFHESHNAIIALFSSLKHSQVKNLDLSSNEVNSADLKEIGEGLRDSRLETLNLMWNNIDDEGVNYLFEALKYSKVVDLNLGINRITGSNSLGKHLKYTKIRTLNLDSNFIQHIEMFDFPDFLKDSSVESLSLFCCYLGDEIGLQIIESLKFSKIKDLNLNSNNLQHRSILEFCKVVNFTNLTEIDLSCNNFQYDEFLALGACLKTSKLKHINLRCFHDYYEGAVSTPFAEFLKGTIGSSLISVDMSINELEEKDAENIAPSLVNTTFTYFDLSCNFLDDGIGNLATYLKFSAITHLNLNNNQLQNRNAKVLAKCLKDTQIVALDIGCNFIKNVGAQALARSLKDSKLLRLILSENEIKNEGLKALAKGAKNTFITILDTQQNLGNKSVLIDTVLWENCKSAQRLICSFKNITIKNDANNLYFDQNILNSDINHFLEDCLFLYKNISQLRSATSVLLAEDTISFSESEISWLMMEQFPKQFCEFIGRRIAADVLEHIDFLKKVENLGLGKVVEHLLLNRPLYVIDETQGILHPSVYKLLHRYRQPICNFAIEPQGKNKLVAYFVKNNAIEGASDVVRLLLNGKT